MGLFDNAAAVSLRGKEVKKITAKGGTVWESKKLVLLEYIESDGASYIDTGIRPSADLRIVVEFQHASQNSIKSAERQYVFGTYHSNNGVKSRAQFFYGGTVNQGGNINTMIGWGQGNVYSGYAWISLNENAIRHTIDAQTGAFAFDGVNWFSTPNPVFDDPMPVFLFACNAAASNVSSPLYYSNGLQIYNAKFYRSGELIGDFTPAYWKSTGETGMFDKVSNSFFPNAGSGVFSGGAKLSE